MSSTGLTCRRLVPYDAPRRHVELPAAAERAVEGDDGHQLVALSACEVELGWKELLITVAP